MLWLPLNGVNRNILKMLSYMFPTLNTKTINIEVSINSDFTLLHSKKCFYINKGLPS